MKIQAIRIVIALSIIFASGVAVASDTCQSLFLTVTKAVENKDPYWFLDVNGYQHKQQYQRLQAGEVSAWHSWLEVVSTNGASARLVDELATSIKMFPYEVRVKILNKIFTLYKEDTYIGFPEVLEFHKRTSMSDEQKQEFRKDWDMPKRIFDRLTPLLLTSIGKLKADLKDRKDPMHSYQAYLDSLSEASNGKFPKYDSTQVYAMLKEIQKTLNRIVESPAHREKTWYGTTKKAYVIIYGSFPNGKADFNKGSDLDLAVSYERLALGDELDFNIFEGPKHITTWDMESAALQALKNSGLSGEAFYDPKSHRFITEQKLYNKKLHVLSPIRFKVSTDSIEIIVDEIK